MTELKGRPNRLPVEGKILCKGKEKLYTTELSKIYKIDAHFTQSSSVYVLSISLTVNKQSLTNLLPE